MNANSIFLVLWALFCGFSVSYAQNYGPELLSAGNFGTTTDGKTGVNTANLYPVISSPNLDSIYSQPPTTVYVNNRTVNSTSPAPQNIAVNPHVKVAPPLTSSQTNYNFGFTEPKYTNLYTFLKKRSGINYPNSAVQIPMAPGDGYYVVATSTAGMYGAPTVISGGIRWNTIYDRYETNTVNPTNYFLIFNSDDVVNKAFYKQKITVTPGVLYRMSADYARLNIGNSPPNLGFIVMTSTGNDVTDNINLLSATPYITTGNLNDDGGLWHTIAFDYVAPCSEASTVDVWIAFVNMDHGTNGNDLALDNLSLKEILQKTTMDVSGNDGNYTITLNAVIGLQAGTENNYTFTWYDGAGNIRQSLTGTTGQIYTFTTADLADAGGYYYTVARTGSLTGGITNTTACAVLSTPITKGVDVITAKIGTENDIIQATPGVITNPYNILDNDCNDINDSGTANCSSENLQVLNFTFSTVNGFSASMDGVIYTPGIPVMVIDNVERIVGVIMLDNDGNLTFQATPDYPLYTNGGLGIVEFDYTVINTENGATATDKVYVTLTQIRHTTTASCVGFPVRVEFDFEEFLPDEFHYAPEYAAYFGVSPTDPIPYPTYFGGRATGTYFQTQVKPSTADDYYAGHINDVVASRYYLVNATTYTTMSDRILSDNITYNNGITDIRRIDVVRTNDYKQGGKIIFEIMAKTPGLCTYQLRRKEIAYPVDYRYPGYTGTDTQEDPIIATVTVEVCPKSATWTGTNSDVWQDNGNWISEGTGAYPTWCTDVLIPPSVTVLYDDPTDPMGSVEIIKNFPIVKQGDACKDIVFKMGASVGGIQNLIYRAAYVNYKPPTIDDANYPAEGKWTMISVPLKYIYSADFQPDMHWLNFNNQYTTNAFTEIKSYMSYFDLAYSDAKTNPDGVPGTAFGSFSRPFANLKQKLGAGFGFVSNVVLTGNGGLTFCNAQNAVGREPYNFYFPRYQRFGNMKLFDGLGNTFTGPSGTAYQEVPYAYHYTDNGEWITTHSNPDYLPFTISQRGVIGVKTLDSQWNPSFYSEITADYGEKAVSYVLPLSNPLAGQDSRYRFIYENASTYGYNKNTGAFTLNLQATGATRIVGNPFMSHLDFDEFYNANFSSIQPYYRLWNGEAFTSYVIDGETYNSNVWDGMSELSTSTSADVTFPAYRYIPPMQAFFVDVTGKLGDTETLSLNFNTAMSTAIPNDSLFTDVLGDGTMILPYNNQLRSGAQSSANNNLLKLRLKMNSIETVALLASLPKATDRYNSNEDIYKLFSYDNTTPEIYTVSDKTAIEINAVSQEDEQKLIPVGIKTNQLGRFDLSIEGVEDFTAYEYVLLRDALLCEHYDLRENSTFTFYKTLLENLEGRFYILLSNSLVGIKNIDPTDEKNPIRIVQEGSAVRVFAPMENIESFEVYDTSGRICFKEDHIGVSSYSWNSRELQGMYIIKVRTNKQLKVQKIRLQTT
jgi:hypothetical protein